MTPSYRTAAPWILAGASLTYLVGWTPNFLVATWLVPLLLIRGVRLAPAGSPAGVLLLLSGVGFLTVRGAWHMGLWAEVGFSVVLAVPLTVALTADRLLVRRLPDGLGTLVFPAVWVVLDWLYSHIYGLGDVFSPALTQFHLAPVLQLASLTGIYGITFLIGWTGSVGALVLAHFEDTARWRRPAAALAGVGLAVLTYGSARLSTLDHDVPTVRVASVVVPHERDYHGEILDKRSPRSEADRFRAELRALEDALFAESGTAARAGSEVVFWAETAAVFYEDHEPDFLARAAAFAREHAVYLQTASLVLRYDSELAKNQVTLFTPTGEVAYTYLKTQTWYPTESDGVIRSHETPWGTLSTVICFDLDVPNWMRQVAALGADVLLVPGFDTKAISPYHTEAGLFRAVEGGYSLVRGVNDGTSMAVDPTGRTLALQDFFRTRERVLYVDVPTRRRWTLYGAVGDWVPALCGLVLLGLLGRARRRTGP